MHRLTDRFEHVAHRELRGELSLLVSLAAEELDRPGSRNTAALREFHIQASRLLATTASHFDREETRLFPAIRLAEDGVGPADRVNRHLREMFRDHAVLRMQLDVIRDLIDRVNVSSACPLVEMLFGSLAALADDIEQHLDDEERTLLGYAWMPREEDSLCSAAHH